jgi:uncharacterized membrane protein YdjX (TVP38/TMEM64 family)
MTLLPIGTRVAIVEGMKRRMRTLAMVLVLLALAAGAWWLQRGALSVERVAQQEELLRQWITEHPLFALGVGFGLYVLLSVVPGTGGKAVVCGWLFGFLQGLAIINFGLTLAAIIAFLFSRYLFYDMVRMRFHALAHRLDEAWRRDGAFYLLTLRFAHAPYSLTNYVSGATGVPMRTFWWTTQLGVLPGAAVCAFLGARLPSLEILANQGVYSLLDPWLIVALALPAAVPALIRYALHRWARRPGALTRRGAAEETRDASSA